MYFFVECDFLELIFMTPRLDNIDAQSLIGNLFASFLIASFHFFSLCLYSQIEHSLPFMHRLIQHLDFVFTRRSSFSHALRLSSSFSFPSHFLKTQRLRRSRSSLVHFHPSRSSISRLLVNPRGTRRIA